MVGRHHFQPSCGLQGREHRRNPDTHRRADRNSTRRAGPDRYGPYTYDNHHGSDTHDHRTNDSDGGAYVDNDNTASLEWVVAKRASCKDLRQYVLAEWTGHPSGWCDCRSRRQQQLR